MDKKEPPHQLGLLRCVRKAKLVGLQLNSGAQMRSARGPSCKSREEERRAPLSYAVLRGSTALCCLLHVSIGYSQGGGPVQGYPISEAPPLCSPRGVHLAEWLET